MESQPKVIILIGSPGCGKSTFAAKLLAANSTYKLLSSDAMRAEFGSGEDDQSVTAVVFATLKRRLQAFLALGQNIIIDATNINKKDRKFYIDTGHESGHQIIGYVFECSKETLLERNKTRGEAGGRNVPEWVIDKMLAKYQRPEKNEGFDELHFK